jgi:uncharacterized lipoprotein NlpE involved in copper resistance
MKRKAFIFILMAAITILGLSSCLSNPAVDKNNAKDNIDWAGVYEGTIPAADCDGINVSMELFKDQTFEMSYEYIGKSTEPFIWKGKFKWDDTGNIIIIDIIDAPNYYKVEKTKLIQLDMKGKPIKGKLAENYVLNRVL